MSLRGRLVYSVLLAVWAVIISWQGAEHLRVRKSARAALLNRAKDISNTLGVVLRSQRHFGVISKERLESALADLVKPGELSGVAMLNAQGDVVASAGAPADFLPKPGFRTAELWGQETVTVMNLVDLGTNLTQEPTRTNPPIVLSLQGFGRGSDTNRPPPPPPREFEGEPSRDPGAPPEPRMTSSSTNRFGRRGEGGGRPRFGRPPGMREEDYRAMIEKQGVHSFVIVMSTQNMRATCRQDLWLRSIIALLATVSVVGSVLALSNLAKRSELEVRLVRASQLNLHLKEMNLAAAGLAHETRNPLNIVRGLAQMISKRDDVSPEIRNKSLQIVDESDRVTAQLNEFINYSRPREVRRSAVALGAVVGEVVRALSGDIEEKKIRLDAANTQLAVEADEQMLRQALFNLLLNATQAVARNGEIQIVATRNGLEAALEVRDNGPGVPAERRSEIFKPYFTTNEKGTGLGLAVVQQIVLAHGWEIECLPNEPHGAVFRITHLKPVAQN
jgi:signal transduction histidine kinase